MVITVTARELLDSGHWEDFCNKEQINEWAINEGLMEDTEEFQISLEDAREYGLVPPERNRRYDW